MRISPAARFASLRMPGSMRKIMPFLLLAVSCSSPSEDAPLDASVAADALELDASLSDAGVSDVGMSDAGVIPELSMAWEPCSLDTAQQVHGTVECATVEVPRHWEQTASATISISVKRFRPTVEARGQLWLLIGGPGISSVWLESLVPYLHSLVTKNLEIYMLDYRGMGRGDRLRCPVEQGLRSEGGATITRDEWTSCAGSAREQWGDLSIFSTENVARDLAALIETTRAEKQVFLYGVSYGTAILQWYVDLFSDQADGVMMDGVIARDARDFPSRFFGTHDRIGQQLLQICSTHPRCSAALGNDPWARLGELSAMIDAGHCPELVARGFDSDRLRDALGVLVQRYEARQFIPAVIHRFHRCNQGDITVLSHFLEQLPPLPTLGDSYGEGRYDSDVLGELLIATELLEDPPPLLQDYDRFWHQLRIAPAGGQSMLITAPHFAHDNHRPPPFSLPNSDLPLLVINGTMDPQTPSENAVALMGATPGPNQHLVLLEDMPHETLINSWTTVAQELPCGMQLMGSFFRDPRAPLDTSCADRLLPIAFEPNPEFVQTLFGTEDLWGD